MPLMVTAQNSSRQSMELSKQNGLVQNGVIPNGYFLVLWSHYCVLTEMYLPLSLS